MRVKLLIQSPSYKYRLADFPYKNLQYLVIKGQQIPEKDNDFYNMWPYW